MDILDLWKHLEGICGGWKHCILCADAIIMRDRGLEGLATFNRFETVRQRHAKEAVS